MKKKIIVPLLVLAVAGAGAFLLVATAPSIEHVTPDRAIAAVRTLEVHPRSIRLQVRTQGTVAPRTETSIVPEVSGRVVWVSPALVSGGFFEADEPLLRLDPRDYENSLKRQRAAVVRARSELEFAESELSRQRGLSERNVASTQQLSAARRSQRVAEADLTDAEAALQRAEWDLARCEITAPFEGRVREKQVDVGQFVTRGVSVATLYATDFAEIRLPVADHQLAFLDLPDLLGAGSEIGPAVRLHARFAGREQEWEGRVVRTEGEIDARSRMVHVIARVDDPYETAPMGPVEPGPTSRRESRAPLAVGLFVHAEIEGPQVDDVIVVPRYAMRDDSHVLIVDVDDRLRTREVEVLRIDRDEVLIQGRLAPGERICISPLQVVVEGMPVNPLPDDEAASDPGEARS